MPEHKLPPLTSELLQRIKLVRRILGSLLFHFTRTPKEHFVEVGTGRGSKMIMPASASAVLNKILHEGALRGTSGWTYGYNCVCFTEVPIQEFNSIFSLVELAASEKERPRYEPYGVAVSKTWLYGQGGRPVIYDQPDKLSALPEDLRYRFVPYDPTAGIDFSWEREWRIRADYVRLDPAETLVILPSAEEAFQIVYEFAREEVDGDEDGPIGVYHVAKWLAVSLDIFGFRANIA